MTEFAGVGQAEGLELWRVEDMAAVKQPQCTGAFHTGDSYILLATTSTGSSLDHKIHFWLGAETSQDEAGVAAYKTVELDDALGGGAVQFREVQGHESSQFMSYFKAKGVEYLPGGVASGFVKVEPDTYRTRLLRVKGKRVARISEVPVASSSLNTGDVFVLDAGLALYVYVGAGASSAEKAKGVETAARIKDDERQGQAKVVLISEDPENKEFWDLLGGYTEVTAEGEPDEAAERVAAEALKLHRVAAGGGTELVATGTDGLKKEMLASGDVYLLDTSQEVFVWTGSDASLEEKKGAMAAATQYVGASGLPPTARVTRMAEGAETAAFKSFFVWSAPLVVPNYLGESSGIAKTGPSLSAAKLGKQAFASAAAADEAPVDDGSGELTIWRLEAFDRVEWTRERYGHFYTGDSFILLYAYADADGQKQHIIYFWQGRDSSTDELGSSAILAKELDTSLGGEPVQVRVTQGKEPPHFRALFGGAMVVHAGGHASGFADVAGDDAPEAAESAAAVTCFQVKGSTEADTYGVEVAAKAASLNSGDSFVVLTPSTAYIWNGKNCASAESGVAAKVAQALVGASKRETVTVAEGDEPAAFWEALGGQGEYAEAAEAEPSPQPPRLFQISNATGTMRVSEVANFDQSDLCVDDVMLLDTFTQVFVWIGTSSNPTEQNAAVDIAKAYVDSATDGRPSGTPIARVACGSEPALFTQHFRGWDAGLLSSQAFVDPYEAKLQALREADAAAAAAEPEPEGAITMDSIRLSLEQAAAAPPAQADETDGTAAPDAAEAPAPEVAAEVEAAAEPEAVAEEPVAAEVAEPVAEVAAPAEEEAPAPVERAPVEEPAAAVAAAAVEEPTPVAAVPAAGASSGSYVPYEELKGPGKMVDGVDMLAKEASLSPEEFLQVFEMTYEEFQAMPKWKQVAAKKKVDLF